MNTAKDELESIAQCIEGIRLHEPLASKDQERGFQLGLQYAARTVRLLKPATVHTLSRAIAHGVNYHSLDARLGMADFAIADLISYEVMKHLSGETGVQIIERMTPEERAAIGTTG